MGGSPARSSELQVECSAADGADAAAGVCAGSLGHVDAEGAAWVLRRAGDIGDLKQAAACHRGRSSAFGQRGPGSKRKGLLRGAGPRETEPTSYPSDATRLEGSAVEATLLVSDAVGVRRVAGVHVRWVAHLRGTYHSTTKAMVSEYSARGVRWPQ